MEERVRLQVAIVQDQEYRKYKQSIEDLKMRLNEFEREYSRVKQENQDLVKELKLKEEVIREQNLKFQ